jgi:hypothetical protein
MANVVSPAMTKRCKLKTPTKRDRRARECAREYNHIKKLLAKTARLRKLTRKHTERLRTALDALNPPTVIRRAVERKIPGLLEAFIAGIPATASNMEADTMVHEFIEGAAKGKVECGIYSLLGAYCDVLKRQATRKVGKAAALTSGYGKKARAK